MNINNVTKSFFVYAFLGWTMENLRNFNDPTFHSCNPVIKHLLSDRMCLLPFLLAYGLGGIFILYLRKKYPNLSIIYKAIIFAIVFNITELISGYVGENYICNKISTCQEKTKMWNYTRTPNLNGYIDVEHTIYWMILGILGDSIYPYIEKTDMVTIIILMLIIWIVIISQKNSFSK